MDDINVWPNVPSMRDESRFKVQVLVNIYTLLHQKMACNNCSNEKAEIKCADRCARSEQFG